MSRMTAPAEADIPRRLAPGPRRRRKPTRIRAEYASRASSQPQSS
jgi:hypothetical protein